MVRLFLRAALVCGLCLAVLGLSTESGFRIVRPENLPLRFAMALTPGEIVFARTTWERVYATPASRRGLPHSGALLAYEGLLLVSCFGLLFCVRRP